MLSWSKCIFGMFESGRKSIYYRGTRVKDRILLLLDLVVPIFLSESNTESTGVLSIATRYEFLRVERQRGMQAAGIEGIHDQRSSLEESGCLLSSIPSVEWRP